MFLGGGDGEGEGRVTGFISDQLEQLESLLSEVSQARQNQEDEATIASRLAPTAGRALGDPEGLIRATIQEMESQFPLE